MIENLSNVELGPSIQKLCRVLSHNSIELVIDDLINNNEIPNVANCDYAQVSDSVTSQVSRLARYNVAIKPCDCHGVSLTNQIVNQLYDQTGLLAVNQRGAGELVLSLCKFDYDWIPLLEVDLVPVKPGNTGLVYTRPIRHRWDLSAGQFCINEMQRHVFIAMNVKRKRSKQWVEFLRYLLSRDKVKVDYLIDDQPGKIGIYKLNYKMEEPADENNSY